MIRKFGSLILVLIFIVLFIGPIRSYFGNLFNKDKDRPDLEERQIIGAVSGYNPRIKEVQNLLKEAGIDSGSADGKMGPRTRSAIKEFQEEKGIHPSGKMDNKTWTALHKHIQNSIVEVEIKYDPSIDWQKSMAIEDRNAKGVFEHSLEKKTEIQDEIMRFRLKSKNRIIQIQTLLKKSGFYKGDIDGKLGSRTKKAIVAFQKSKGLNPDGIIGPKTWEELNKYNKE